MLTLHFQSSARIINQKEYNVPSLFFISLENPCMIATIQYLINIAMCDQKLKLRRKQTEINYDAEDALEQNIISDCDADLS